jgi:hypothetical protein
MVKDALKDCWHKIELAEAQAIANARILSEAELEALQFKTTPLTPEEKLDLQKTLLLKWFGQQLIDATTYEHDTGKILTGYAAMALKNERGVYRQRLENFYLLASDEGEAIGKDIAAEMSQLKHNHGRFPGDIRWRSRQRKARAWLGLPQFLNPEKWYEPNDYRAIGQKAKSKAPMIKDCLNLSVDKISDGQIFGELMSQLGLELDKEWAAVKPGQRRFKRRRISASSWRFAQMYVQYQEQIKAEREASTSPQLSHEELCQSDHPPQYLYTESSFRGGVITESSQVEQVEMLTQQLDGSIKLRDNVVCDSGCANLITPPSIYSETSFLGGGDQDLSQVEQVEMLTQQLDGSIKLRDNVVCDSDCANLITPPSIYSETSFLGGGDQDLSQGVGEVLEGGSSVEELAEALEFCETPDLLAAVAQGYELSQVQEAIALQDGQPRRQQLTAWYEAIQQLASGENSPQQLEAIATHPPPGWQEKAKTCGELLIEAIACGIEAVKALLQPWSEPERWAAILKAEELSPEAMERLLQIEPNWTDLCVVG